MEFIHPDEQDPNETLNGQPLQPFMLFTFLSSSRPVGYPNEWQFYVWASVTEGDEVVAWDYGPDFGWLALPPPMIRSRRSAGHLIAFAMLMSGCGVTETPTATSDPTASNGESSMSAGPSAAGVPVPFPVEASILELQAAMETGDQTSVELVAFYLERIVAYDGAGPELNALIQVNPRASEEAAALDAERAASGPRGPLHGIPVVVKDNLNTSDLPTTGGTPALEEFIPAEDAFQVARLREAGAIIIAKANLYELAHGCGNDVAGRRADQEPIRPQSRSLAARVAGGRGRDRGSCRRRPRDRHLLDPSVFQPRITTCMPAAADERPSSRTGVIPYSFTLDTVGPMARNVVDLAILLDATAGQDPADETTVAHEASFMDAVGPGGLADRRVGLVNRSVTGEVDDVLQAAFEEMEANGVEFVDVPLPTGAQSLVPTFLSEFRFALEDYVGGEPTGAELLAQILAQDPDAANVPSLETDAYRDALASREEFRDAVMATFEEHDLDAIAYPVSITGRTDWWLAGWMELPGLQFRSAPIAMPAGFTSDGLPVLGLVLMARPFDEATLLLTILPLAMKPAPTIALLPPTTPPPGTTP